LNAAQRNAVECAAALKNLAVADFVARSALEAARRAIKGQRQTVLSPRDTETFVQALTDAPPVNSRLRDTVRRYRARTGI
jgi:uncharacterized protein (DUF1778 family)